MSYLTLIKKEQDDFAKRTIIWKAIYNRFIDLQLNDKCFSDEAKEVKNTIVEAIAKFKLGIFNEETILEFLSDNIEDCLVDDLKCTLLEFLQLSEDFCWYWQKHIVEKVDLIKRFQGCFSNDDFGIVMFWLFSDGKKLIDDAILKFAGRSGLRQYYRERVASEAWRDRICLKNEECEDFQLPETWGYVDRILANLNHNETKSKNEDALKSLEWDSFPMVPYRSLWESRFNSETKKNYIVFAEEGKYFTKYATVYELVQFKFRVMTSFKSAKEAARDRRMEMLAKIDDNRLMRKVLDNFWTKEQARLNLHHWEFLRAVELDTSMKEEGGNLFSEKNISADAKRSITRAEKSEEKIRNLRKKVIVGEKLTGTERTYLSQHGLSVRKILEEYAVSLPEKPLCEEKKQLLRDF